MKCQILISEKNNKKKKKKKKKKKEKKMNIKLSSAESAKRATKVKLAQVWFIRTHVSRPITGPTIRPDTQKVQRHLSFQNA